MYGQFGCGLRQIRLDKTVSSNCDWPSSSIWLHVDYDRPDWTRQCHRTVTGQVQAYGQFGYGLRQTRQDKCHRIVAGQVKSVRPVWLRADYDRSDWTRQCHRTVTGQVQAYGQFGYGLRQTRQDKCHRIVAGQVQAYSQFGCMWTATDQTAGRASPLWTVRFGWTKL